jgi:exonuclease SbcC
MHLNKLVMKNFKKFRRAELEFSDGLTGIVGSNGSGKSTIVEAIAWALYGNRASSIKRDFIRNARAKESDAVETSLTLSLGKQELVIYRAMKGKSLTPEAFLVLDGQRIATGSKEVDARLEDILKINYQDFMKTFYARQKDLDNLLKEGGDGQEGVSAQAPGPGRHQGICHRSDQIRSSLFGGAKKPAGWRTGRNRRRKGPAGEGFPGHCS